MTVHVAFDVPAATAERVYVEEQCAGLWSTTARAREAAEAAERWRTMTPKARAWFLSRYARAPIDFYAPEPDE